MKEFIEKLIERLEEHCGIKSEVCDCNGVCSECDFKASIEIVNQLAEEYKGNLSENLTSWISCSERLPEEAFGCLVTVMDYEPMTGNEFENILPYHVGFDGETWNDIDGKIIPFEVIAWQPLPQPYKEGVDR